MKKNLKYVIDESGACYKDIAKIAQVSPSTLSQIISGRQKGTAHFWVRLALELDLTVSELEYLMEDTENETEEVKRIVNKCYAKEYGKSVR